MRNLNIVFLGMTITSSVGNDQASTYRALCAGLAGRGHRVTFLERYLDQYAGHFADLSRMAGVDISVYSNLEQLRDERAALIREADAVLVGSGVPEGAAVGDWCVHHADGVVFFYDHGPADTLVRLQALDHGFITPALLRRYDAVLSATGGAGVHTALAKLGAHKVHTLYPGVDRDIFYPSPSGGPAERHEADPRFDVGCVRALDEAPLLAGAAKRWSRGRFTVGRGSRTRATLPNVTASQAETPMARCAFLNGCRFLLVTSDEASAWTPPREMFEAAAAGVGLIVEPSPGIEAVFQSGLQFRWARSAEDVVLIARELRDESYYKMVSRARQRVVAEHTGDARAARLEAFVREARERRAAEGCTVDVPGLVA